MPTPWVEPIVARAADRASAALVLVDGPHVLWCNESARALVEPFGGTWERPAALLALLEPIAPGVRRAGVRWPSPAGGIRWWLADCHDPGSGEHARLYELIDSTVLEKQGVGVLPAMAAWEWDLVDDRVSLTPALADVLGVPRTARLDFEVLSARIHPEDAATLNSRMRTSLRTLTPWWTTLRVQPVDHTDARTFEALGEVVAAADGVPVRMHGVVRDITEYQATARHLDFVTEHDVETGVASRRRMMARLAELADTASPSAVLVVDVDHFKDINELRGFVVGDEVLRTLAVMIRSRIGPDAMLGRLGGDEFGVILTRGTPEEVLALGNAVCTVVAETPVTTVGPPVRFTVSVGAASVVSGDVEASLGAADLALDEAKRTGRNRALLFTPDLYRVAERRVTLLSRVADALDNGSMNLDAQPIVDLDTGAVTRYELLIRLRDGLQPVLGPAEFLPHVEGSDLVHRLDRWVLERAVAALATPRATAVGLRLEANLSGRALENADLGSWILDELGRQGVAPGRLGVEITETAAVREMEAAAVLADQLIDAGCGFALDDFGAGFGSFSYLKHLRFTSLKIAGEFVHQADHDRVDRALVAAMVGIARQLGMLTVAEQVDRPELVPLLRGLGVDHGQGYFHGRPVPLATLLDAPGPGPRRGGGAGGPAPGDSATGGSAAGGSATGDEAA